MTELVTRVPNLPTKEAMTRVRDAFRTVAKKTDEGNVVFIEVHFKLKYWLLMFDPKQGPCSLTKPSSVYMAAMRALRVFTEEIDGGHEVRCEVARQVMILDCLREK